MLVGQPTRIGRIRGIVAVLTVPWLTACAPLPHGVVGTALPAHWQSSPNFDVRRPGFVVLHQTSNDTAARALATLTDPDKKVSAHYLIGRDGTVHQLVDERVRAWHAGASFWGGLTDLNSASLGIELDNTGDEPFAATQIAVLLDLLADIKQRYRIPAANFIGHGDIAPTRKVDPSRHFPWKLLAARGFGLWCDAPAAPPPAFDARLGLRALGYDIADFSAAVRAFRRHYAGDDAAGEMTEPDKAVLYCLVNLQRGGE